MSRDIQAQTKRYSSTVYGIGNKWPLRHFQNEKSDEYVTAVTFSYIVCQHKTTTFGKIRAN